MAKRKSQSQGESSRMASTKQDTMLREHEKTYHGFMRLLAVCAGAIIVVLILMAIFLL